MTKTEFDEQMKRLQDNWPNSYQAEKIKLIWLITKDMPNSWFRNLVDKLITHSRSAPMPVEFIEAFETWKKNNTLKVVHENPWGKHKSIFSEQEIKEMFAVAKAAAIGKISRKDAIQYADMVADVLRANGIQPDPYERD